MNHSSLRLLSRIINPYTFAMFAVNGDCGDAKKELSCVLCYALFLFCWKIMRPNRVDWRLFKVFDIGCDCSLC